MHALPGAPGGDGNGRADVPVPTLTSNRTLTLYRRLVMVAPLTTGGQMKKWLKPTALALGLLGISAAAIATPMTWTLSNLVYSNDGPTPVTATGSFKYDADTNTFSDVNISTSQGAYTDAAVYTQVCNAPGCSTSSSATDILLISAPLSGDMTGDQHMHISLQAPMTNAGGAVAVQYALHLKCGSPACSFGGSGQRNADLGASLTATAVVPPGPGSAAAVPTLNQWGLILLGSLLSGFALLRQRRKL